MMRTTFGSFNIATTGLFASQRSLDITGHNIVNANTEGYSRQAVLQRATAPIGGDPRGIVGTGVETYDIIRFRSAYLDSKYWGQMKAYTEWQAKKDGLEDMEAIFNEPSDTGIRKTMDDFFISMEEVVKKSGDRTNRIAMIEKAGMLANSINRNGHEILNAIRDTNFAVKIKVDDINSIASQIAILNRQIFNMELGGNRANDLQDKRTLLVDQLSKIVNISVSEVKGENNNAYFSVKIGGINLVNHIDAYKLTTVESEVPGISDIGGGKISTVMWADADGNPTVPVKVEGGELKGLLDLRDGDGLGQNYRGFPFYLEQLNRFARDFAREFNIQHRSGFDLNGNAGGNFFEEPDGADMTDKWKNINCVNFKVDPAVLEDPSLVAASSTGDDGIDNNENIKLLAEFREKTDVFYDASGAVKIKGTSDDFIKSVLSALAVDASQANRMTNNAEAIVEQTELRRMSVSGVSLDEEMTNMIKYQQAYNASARMITTMDEVLDTMINRLGLVGR